MLNPEMSVPHCMLGSIAINSVLGFAFLLAILFCMGDMDAALNSSTGFPIIEIFRSVTGSAAASSAMTSTLILIAGLATIPLLASTARMVWSLARDRGKSDLIPIYSQVGQLLTLHSAAILILLLKGECSIWPTRPICPSNQRTHCSSRVDKYRIDDSVQRDSFLGRIWPSCIIYSTDWVLPLASHRNARDSDIWTVATWSLWCSDQCFCFDLLALHQRVYGLPAISAGHACEYELCVFDLWCGADLQRCILGLEGPEVIRGSEGIGWKIMIPG